MRACAWVENICTQKKNLSPDSRASSRFSVVFFFPRFVFGPSTMRNRRPALVRAMWCGASVRVSRRDPITNYVYVTHTRPQVCLSVVRRAAGAARRTASPARRTTTIICRHARESYKWKERKKEEKKTRPKRDTKSLFPPRDVFLAGEQTTVIIHNINE